MAVSAQENLKEHLQSPNSKVHKALLPYDSIYILGRILHVEIAKVKEQSYKVFYPEDTG